MNIVALLLSIIILLAVRMYVWETFFLDEYDENVSKMQIKPTVDRFEQHNQILDIQKTGQLRVRTLELVKEVRGRLSTMSTVSSHQLS